MLGAWHVILVAFVAFVAVGLGRAVVVVSSATLLKRAKERFPRPWIVVLTWGGLRGALSMVLVLGLPASFPHREDMETLTFGVVLLSILLQGMTMGPLLRKLGIAAKKGVAAAETT